MKYLEREQRKNVKYLERKQRNTVKYLERKQRKTVKYLERIQRNIGKYLELIDELINDLPEPLIGKLEVHGGLGGQDVVEDLYRTINKYTTTLNIYLFRNFKFFKGK